MDILPITLGIARPLKKKRTGKSSEKGGGKTSSSSTSGHKLTLEEKQKIFKRDDYTCRCCGFQSQKYQEIHFINHDSADTRPKNMATTCIFCYQCFQIDRVSSMRSGVLIWLPEIEQAELHHIARAIYVARISQGPIADAARRSLDVIMSRRAAIVERIGTDDPYILSTVLSDYLGPKHYQMRQKKLEGVRIFPLDRRIIKEADLEFNQFPQILAYWRSKDGPFGGKPPTQWVSIYQELTKAA